MLGHAKGRPFSCVTEPMCGIVGLFLKNSELERDLGCHLSAMLSVLSDRGPDSAGFAVYSNDGAGGMKLTLRATEAYGWEELIESLAEKTGIRVDLEVRDTHGVLRCDPDCAAEIREALASIAPGVSIVGSGFSMEIYKEAGYPTEVAKRFALEKMSGTHGIGHTRMATESAVTTKGAHPFTAGPDQCLVHNGSLSNHNSVRRNLMRQGLRFETENDSEVAAAFLTGQMNKGLDLSEALEMSLGELDGFYTFVVGTASGFGVLRDPIACKPAVMAETDGYVAFGSEYRALTLLPDISTAHIWEPEPAQVYFWERSG
jgi:methylamine---glutamate N-methyltransferase subunit A